MRFEFDARQLEDRFVAPLRDGGRRLITGAAIALTKTGVILRDAERAEMRDVFDRPTPYTLRALFLKPATAANPVAMVGIKDNVGGSRSAVSWLRWQIRGGLRVQTAFERLLVRGGAMRDDQRAVPGKFARIDAFGNVSRGQLVQILGQLRIDSTVGSSRSLPRIVAEDNPATAQWKARRIASSYRRAGGQYLALPNGRGRLAPGIYQVRQFAHGRSDPRPVIVYVTQAQYEARFDFFGHGLRVIARELPAQLQGQLARWLLRGVQTSGDNSTSEGME